MLVEASYWSKEFDCSYVFMRKICSFVFITLNVTMEHTRHADHIQLCVKLYFSSLVYIWSIVRTES